MSGKTDFDLKDEAVSRVARVYTDAIENMLKAYMTMYPDDVPILLEHSKGLSHRKVWVKERPQWFVEFSIIHDNVIVQSGPSDGSVFVQHLNRADFDLKDEAAVANIAPSSRSIHGGLRFS